MQYIALILRLAIVAIGVFMMISNPTPMSPPFCSGLAFIFIGASLCLNRLMAVKGTPCLLKCFNKKK